MSPLYVHTHPADENDPDSEERKVLLGHYLFGDEDKGEFNGFALQKDCCCGAPGYWECKPQICAGNLWRGFSPTSGARKPDVRYLVYVSESAVDSLADEGVEFGPGYEWLIGGQIWQITEFLGDGNLTREELGIDFPDFVQIILERGVTDHTPSPNGEAGLLGSCRITGSPFQTPSASEFNSLTLGGALGVVQTWHLGCQLLLLGPGELEGGWSRLNAYPVSMSYKFARVTGKHLIQFRSTDDGGPVLREELVNLSHQHTRNTTAYGTFLDPPLPFDSFDTGYTATQPGNPPVTTRLYWPVFYSGLAPSLDFCWSEKNFYIPFNGGPKLPTCNGTGLFSPAVGIGPSFCKGIKDASRQTNPDPFDQLVWPDDFDCPVFFDEPCGLADGADYQSANRYDPNPTPGNVNPNPVQNGGSKSSVMVAKMSPCQVLSGEWSYNPANAMACCCDYPQGTGGGYNAAFLLIGDVSGNGCIERYPEPPIIPGVTFQSDAFPGGTTIFDEFVTASFANEFIAISGGTLENS
jgi:hypothetical protein